MVQFTNKLFGLVKRGRISIRVTQDGSKATLSYSIGFGKPVTLEEINIALQRNGIVHGLDHRRIKNSVDSDPKNAFLICAEWTPAKNGQDSDIELLISEEKKLVIDRDGSVDYREIEYFKEVKEGQPVACKIPATSGSPGISVKGEMVQPVAGVDHGISRFIGGKGVRVSDTDENILVAARSGIYFRVGKKVDVKEKLTVRGNLNFKYGNIKTAVDVEVYGDVMSGFKLESEKDITVMGVIENSQVHAGGNLRVDKGLVKGDAAVSAGGKLKTKYITDRLNVRASEIEVANNITNSHVTADRYLKTRRLTGGKITAGHFIAVNDLGNIHSSATFLELGVNADLLTKTKELSAEAELLKFKRHKSREAYYEAKSKYVEANRQLEERLFNTARRVSPQILGRLELTINNAAELARKHKRIMDDYDSLLKDTLKEISEIAPEISYAEPQVIVTGVVYPNVSIKIGLMSSYKTSGEMSRLKFVLGKNGKVVMESLPD